MPLEDVQGVIVAQLTDERARAAVDAAAVQATSSLRAGEQVEAYATSAGYQWQVELAADRRNTMVPADILQSAFQLAAPAEGSSVIDYVLSANGDALVYEVTRVSPGELASLPESDRAGLEQIVGGEYGQLIDNEYRQGLQDSADISVL